MQLAFIRFFLVILMISRSEGHQCNDCIGGTYQVKIQVGTLEAYQLATLKHDGAVHIIDNTQNGFTPDSSIEAQPFTELIGQWRCIGQNQIRVHCANFILKNPNSAIPSTLAFNKAVLNFANKGKTVRGSATVAYYRPGDHPNDRNTNPLPGFSFGPYNITG